MLDLMRAGIGADRELHILRNVDHDRPRAAVLRDIEGLVQDAREIVDLADEIIMLGAMAGDADRVAFLERVRADKMRRDLAGDADQRDRIHQGVGQAGDGVGRAGAGGHEKHADLAARSRESLGGMGRALLVAHQHMLDMILMEQGVVNRQDGAAGIAEDRLDALILQGAHDHFRAGQQIGHVLAPQGEFHKRWGNKKGP